MNFGSLYPSQYLDPALGVPAAAPATGANRQSGARLIIRNGAEPPPGFVHEKAPPPGRATTQPIAEPERELPAPPLSGESGTIPAWLGSRASSALPPGFELIQPGPSLPAGFELIQPDKVTLTERTALRRRAARCCRACQSSALSCRRRRSKRRAAMLVT